jgi:hypothetical protein
MPEINTKLDLIQHVQATGSHFFCANAMKFFSSRLLEPIIQRNGRVYFLTSERFMPLYGHPAARKYTIRTLDLADSNASIDEIGAFQEYQTARQARQALFDYLDFLDATKE